MSSAAAALREEDKTLLVAILKGVTSGQMNFDRVGTEMNITKRAASERWARLRTKLWGKKREKEFSLREDDKSLLLAILKGLTAADMDFERVSKDMGGISKRAASERYGRLKTKLWGKGGPASAAPPRNNSESKGKKTRITKKVNYEEDEGDSGASDKAENEGNGFAGDGAENEDDSAGNADVTEEDEASVGEREDQDQVAASQHGYAQLGDEEVEEEFHDAQDECEDIEA